MDTISLPTASVLSRYIARALACVACAGVFAAGLATAQTSPYLDLHDFGGTITNTLNLQGPDGSGSNAKVTFDSNGNMYGTSIGGGAYNEGIVWEITKSGTYIDLHDFGGTVLNTLSQTVPDGAFPYGPVAFDASGNMFGTAYDGGSHGTTAGMVWEITKTGAYIDLHDFGGTVTNAIGQPGPDGQNPFAGVTVDGNGNLFGATFYGGSIGGRGMVWEITTTGTYLDLHDFGGTVLNSAAQSVADGTNPNGNVVFDANGNLFGTASSGGANPGNGMIWEMTHTGAYVDLHDFGGTLIVSGQNVDDGFTPDCPVVVDAIGNLFGTTYSGGAHSDGILWEITSGGVYADVHDFGGTVLNALGQSVADCQNPYSGLTIDKFGTIFGTAVKGGSLGVGIVFELPKDGTFVDLHDFGGTVSSGGHSVSDGDHPYGSVVVDPAGDLFGTATQGGANFSGMVWEISSGGPSVVSLTFSPSTVVGGTSTRGTATLNALAPSGGQVIKFSSNDPHVVPPTQNTVPAGATIASFNVNTLSVSTVTSATVTATCNGSQVTTGMTLNPTSLASISMNPSAVTGGTSSVGTVTLSVAVPTGGTPVALSSGNSIVTVPSSVTVAAGSLTATFTATTSTVNVSTGVSITGSLYGASKAATLTVLPPSIISFTVSPVSVVGGASSRGTVTIGTPAAAGGQVIKLSSNNSNAIPPSQNTIPAGGTTANFGISTVGVSTPITATLTATSGSSSLTANLAILPPTILTYSVTPSTVVGGASSRGLVTVNYAAPAGGLVIKLSSNSASAIPPTQNTIPAGGTTASFTITTLTVLNSVTATLTATCNGATATATLTINP